MTTIRETWIAGAERLAAAGIESARLDARVLLAHTMNLAPGETVSSREPSAEELARYEELLARRAAREPTAYIIGEREFWSLPFEVGPGVLVPRPETETLIECAVEAFPDRDAPLDVLDLGTGSGCLLISFLHGRPRANGTGIDRSGAALSWARRNGERLGVSRRIIWREEDWSQAGLESYDVIFSNPPYLSLHEGEGLAPEVVAFEPNDALFAGDDGLQSYRVLGPLIAAALKPGGRAFLEIGLGQGDKVSEILRPFGLEILGVRPDLAGIPRCVATQRIPGFSRPAAEKTVGKQASSR